MLPHRQAALLHAGSRAVAIWACAEAALEAGAPLDGTSSIVSKGDCLLACSALNRATSATSQMRALLQQARAQHLYWLGVQVPRELNLDADVLSHPSRFQEVWASAIAAGLLPIRATIPDRCWSTLRDIIAMASRANKPDDLA